MISVVDNYDSFTYNLVQYLGELGQDLMVFRNNKAAIEEVERLNPEGLPSLLDPAFLPRPGFQRNSWSIHKEIL